jgi:hypothetical protein
MAVSQAAHQYSWRGHTGSHGGEPAASLLLSATCVILLSSHPNAHVFFSSFNGILFPQNAAEGSFPCSAHTGMGDLYL